MGRTSSVVLSRLAPYRRGWGSTGAGFLGLPLDTDGRSACTAESRVRCKKLDAGRAGYGGTVMKAVAPSRRCIFRLPG
jgi:hypothetical protein